MKKAFLLLCLFAACLITGFTLGASAALAREQQARALAGAQVTGQPQEEENQAGIEALPSGQRNILVIGVDDLQADEPALESLWLILYYPPAPGINLAPLFPARLQNDPETGLALDEAFALDENGTPVPAFFESIQRRDLWWNNYMLIDRPEWESWSISLAARWAMPGTAPSCRLTSSPPQPGIRKALWLPTRRCCRPCATAATKPQIWIPWLWSTACRDTSTLT